MKDSQKLIGGNGRVGVDLFTELGLSRVITNKKSGSGVGF